MLFLWGFSKKVVRGYMQRILSKNKRRQLALIELLDDENQGRLIEDLARHFGVTRQTITRDFEEINQSMNATEIVEEQGFYHVHFSDGTSLQTIYNDIINEDPGFQLFELIFYNENISVENLAKQIGTSTSTAYKMIERFREPLSEHFNLDISTRPVRLVGSEKDIRSFYNQYFSEKYNQFTLDMDLPVERELFDEYLEIAASIVAVDIPFTYKHFYKIVAAVNLIRYLQGHLLDAKFKDLTPIIEEFRSNETIRDKIAPAFPVELTDEAIYQIMGQFVFENYFFIHEEYEQAIKDNELLRFSQMVLEETVSTIENDYGIKCPNAEEIYWLMHNTANQAEMDYLAIPLLNNRKQKFIHEVEKAHPELFAYIANRLELFCRMMNVRCSKHMRNHMIFSFYTFWKGLFPGILDLYRPVKILVVSNYETYHACLIRDLLKIRFGNHIDVKVYEEASLKIDSLLQCDYDFIVSNFMITGLDERPLVLVNDYLQLEDYTKVYIRYKEVQHNSRKNK